MLRPTEGSGVWPWDIPRSYHGFGRPRAPFGPTRASIGCPCGRAPNPPLAARPHRTAVPYPSAPPTRPCARAPVDYAAGVPPKRHLPVLKEASGPDSDAPVRPPWQWVGFGALGIFVLWLPLAWLAARVLLPFGAGQASALSGALTFAASLVLSALAGGYLVGRWGTRGVGVRQAALAGLSAALVAALAGSAGLSLGLRALIVAAAVAVAVPPAALGGRLGMKRRSGAW